MSPDRRPWAWAVGLCVAVLLLLTLLPQDQIRGINLRPLSQAWRAIRSVFSSPHPPQHPAFQYLLVQVVGNVVAFIPFGFSVAGYFRFARPRLASAALALGAGFTLSLVIELLQLTMSTRATDIDDLIFNTTGTALGALLLLLVPRSRFGRTGAPP